jgi:hypothetical protein
MQLRRRRTAAQAKACGSGALHHRARSSGILNTAVGIVALLLFAGERAIAQESEQLRTDSRSPYVHRITLYDENGIAIAPDDEPAQPYSPSHTCGKCHPVARVAGGWHFNAGDPEVPPGRRGAPWILSDPRTGTSLPISARGWPGTFTPSSIGLTDWAFVKRFGGHSPSSGHSPGSGPGEPSEGHVEESPESIRWRISGAFETDCMVCHSANMQHDPAEASRQIERENFKWSPTAALGLAVIRGEARSMPDDWDPLLPPSPDFPEQNPPAVIYDRAAFDADDRVRFDVTRRPAPARCEFCHSARDVSREAPSRWTAQEDVHLRAGLSCTDCHRNDVGHRIVRGYDGEAAERNEPAVAVYSCSGCHLGVTGAPDAGDRLGGRYGAPRPEHRGMPPVHFERLTCTACHSGPWPEALPRRVQTATTHGLGIPDKHRRDDDPPGIVEPIFAADESGRIAPHRMIWPAYFGWMSADESTDFMKGAEIKPLPLDVVERAVEAAIQGEVRAAKKGEVRVLGRQQVISVLGWLAERPEHQPGWPIPEVQRGWPVRVAGGRVYWVDPWADSAAFQHFDHPAARPYLWPIGHQVRPALQSLGVRGCDDCHSPGAAFFFGSVAPAGRDRPVKVMFELQNVDERLVRTWATSFRYRPAFKWFTFGATALVLAILVIYGLRGLSAVLRRLG